MSGTDDPTHVYWDLENRKGLWARGEAMRPEEYEGEMMDPRRGEVCVICGHEAVSIPPRWQHYMVAGRERAICATCVEGALFAALPVKP